MLLITHTVATKAKAETIWKIWEDVSNWNTWDHGIEFSTLEGPFRQGTKGTLKPKGGPLVHTILGKVEPMRMFVDESKLPLGRIVMSHFLEEKDGKMHVTHQIEMRGPLAFFYAFVIGRTMKKNLPDEMLSMVKKAEHLDKQS